MKRIAFRIACMWLLCAVAACASGRISVNAVGVNAVGGLIPATRSTFATSAALRAQALASVAIDSSTNAAGVHIDAGGSTDGIWLADRYFDGGKTSSVSSAIDTRKVANPAPQSVYKSVRYAVNLTYTIPKLTPGHPYLLRLHFVESTFSNPGRRVFSVSVNGKRVLSDLDIFAAAGGKNIAIARSFASSAQPNGEITVAFAATVDDASVAALELLPTAPDPTPSPHALMNGVVTSSLASWNRWAGHALSFVGVYNDVGASSWSSLDDILWEASTYPRKSNLFWSIASYPTSANLWEVADGAGAVYYWAWAEQILGSTEPAPDGYYYIRPNWEVPDSWSRWGTQCSESRSACISAYRQIASVFHAASSKFRMVWDTIPVYNGPNNSINATDNAVYYPGDAYVDVISQDIYMNTAGGNSVSGQWDYALKRTNGLNWVAQFAAAHKKRIAVSEWGVNSNDAGPFIVDFQKWLVANHALYAMYFDIGTTRMSSGKYPAAGAVLRSYY